VTGLTQPGAELCLQIIKKYNNKSYFLLYASIYYKFLHPQGYIHFVSFALTPPLDTLPIQQEARPCLVSELFCQIAKSQIKCSAHQNADNKYFTFAVYFTKKFAKLHVMQLH